MRPGDVLTVETEILDLRPSRSKPGYGIIRLRNVTRNQGGEIVQTMLASARYHGGSKPTVEDKGTRLENTEVDELLMGLRGRDRKITNFSLALTLHPLCASHSAPCHSTDRPFPSPNPDNVHRQRLLEVATSSIRVKSLLVRATSSAPAFSCKYLRRLVPGMGTMSFPCASTQASG